jgi:hypothetical protein
MDLEGSCHCGAVRFALDSHEPWPYQRCYCSICRKTGGADCMINIGGDMTSMHVEGLEHVRVYRAMLESDGKRVRSRHQRHFCGLCGCHLWAWHPAWPNLVHPVASAIDTPLPAPPSQVHMMTGSRAPWVEPPVGSDDETYEEYPDRSLSDWHREHGYGSGGS